MCMFCASSRMCEHSPIHRSVGTCHRCWAGSVIFTRRVADMPESTVRSSGLMSAPNSGPRTAVVALLVVKLAIVSGCQGR